MLQAKIDPISKTTTSELCSDLQAKLKGLLKHAHQTKLDYLAELD
jgi:hypothetical protein